MGDKEYLTGLYYNPGSTAGFTGATQLIRHARNRVDKTNVDKWLQSQDAYTLHRPVRRKFPRLHYNVRHIDSVFEIDLCDMQSLKSYNDGVTFLLVVIDVLSKYAFVEPLKNKSAKQVGSAFEKILKSTDRRPITVQSDAGKEFVGREFQDVLKRHDILFRVARNPDIKASIAERFNRTLKTRIWRYFTFSNSKRYIDVLQDIVTSYNNTVHSSIKMAPAVVTVENAQLAWENIQKRYKPVIRKAKYNCNQHVRISRAKGIFEKGYEAGFTEEIFKITKVLAHRKPPVYVLEDLNGTEVDGIFYEEELVPVIIDESDTFIIDKIIKSTGVGRNKKYFVSWSGYPQEFNSWVRASDMQKI